MRHTNFDLCRPVDIAPEFGRLRFVRHGATAPNLAGLACGGDLDVPLTDVGRHHAEQVVRRVRDLDPPIGLVVTSDLLRTRETAAIVAEGLGDLPIKVMPLFGERRLGEWNLRPTEKTRPWLASGLPPPGGESEEEFVERVAAALRLLLPLLPQRPLVVGSRGVARALGVLLQRPERVDLANGALMEFDLGCFDRQVTCWDEL